MASQIISRMNTVSINGNSNMTTPFYRCAVTGSTSVETSAATCPQSALGRFLPIATASYEAWDNQLSIEIFGWSDIALKEPGSFHHSRGIGVAETIVIGSNVALNKTLIIRWSLYAYGA